jgi:hypothetical protein
MWDVITAESKGDEKGKDGINKKGDEEVALGR